MATAMRSPQARSASRCWWVITVDKFDICCVLWLDKRHVLKSVWCHVAAMHQLCPQRHHAQTKGSLLRLLVYLEACPGAASEAATCAEHN